MSIVLSLCESLLLQGLACEMFLFEGEFQIVVDGQEEGIPHELVPRVLVSNHCQDKFVLFFSDLNILSFINEQSCEGMQSSSSVRECGIHKLDYT